MNDQVKYSLAGFCMGVAELIPGISGATVAVIFKIYPNLMQILSQLKLKNLTLNIRSLSEIFQLKLSLPLIFFHFSISVKASICSSLDKISNDFILSKSSISGGKLDNFNRGENHQLPET